jgi:hypothetical protein
MPITPAGQYSYFIAIMINNILFATIFDKIRHFLITIFLAIWWTIHILPLLASLLFPAAHGAEEETRTIRPRYQSAFMWVGFI